MHEDVTTAWERAVAEWDDPARHEAVISAVVQHNCFAWAAQKYKERAGDPIADKQLDRLRKAATATLFATATARQSKEENPYRKGLMWMLVLAIFAVMGLVFARVVLDNTPSKPASGTTPARP